jgi:hypothetical protein
LSDDREEQLDVIPRLRSARFEQLDPGDLFIYLDGGLKSYALKTEPRGDRSGMVMLGPTFFRNIQESFLVSWQPATVLCFGRDFSIFPSTDPADWALNGNTRSPVCLAVAGEQIFICTNGGSSPQDHHPSYVNVDNGEIIDGHLPSAVFTRSWRLSVLGDQHPPCVLLSYPLDALDGQEQNG